MTSAGEAPAQLTVYVAYHEAAPHPDVGAGPYTAVCNTRADGSRPPGFAAYDDDGGFPDRNAAYCELSVHRRLQMRSSTPYVGLCHYRRVFLARAPRAPRGVQRGTFHLSAWDWARTDAQGAGERDLLAALGDRDWCTTEPLDVRRAGFDSLWQQFAANHPETLLRAADEAVAELHPALPRLREHLQQAHRVPLFNMFLGRRPVFEIYSSFLWPVLEACADAWQPDPADAYQRRWAGFVAERLHGYWLEHVARPAGVRVGTLPIALLAPSSIRSGLALPPRVSYGRERLRGIRRIEASLPTPILYEMRRAKRACSPARWRSTDVGPA